MSSVTVYKVLRQDLDDQWVSAFTKTHRYPVGQLMEFPVWAPCFAFRTEYTAELWMNGSQRSSLSLWRCVVPSGNLMEPPEHILNVLRDIRGFIHQKPDADSMVDALAAYTFLRQDLSIATGDLRATPNGTVLVRDIIVKTRLDVPQNTCQT